MQSDLNSDDFCPPAPAAGLQEPAGPEGSVVRVKDLTQMDIFANGTHGQICTCRPAAGAKGVIFLLFLVILGSVFWLQLKVDGLLPNLVC